MGMRLPKGHANVKMTAMVCCIAMVCLGIYDGIMVSTGGLPSSISRWLADTGFNAPAFVFAFGFIAGHVFGFMRQSLKSAFAPALQTMPDGWLVDVKVRRGWMHIELSDVSGKCVAVQELANNDLDELLRSIPKV